MPTVKVGNEATHTLPEDEFKRLMPAELPGELGRLGQYRVLKLLASGDMGAVFLDALSRRDER